MNEGASACAGGVTGACDKLIYPNYLVPGIIVLSILLVAVVLLINKKIIKYKLKYIILIWTVMVLAFIGLIIVNTKTVGEQTKYNQEICKLTKDGTCEY